MPQGALVNFLTAMRDRFKLGAGDRLVAVTTVGFDIAGLELFVPLLSGASITLAERDVVGTRSRCAVWCGRRVRP
ncbi:hypothetical protein STENM36S_06541 [Streptomyces tendae]